MLVGILLFFGYATNRISDIALSLLILPLVPPVMQLLALGVKLSSPGPVLFKQRCYGLDGTPPKSAQYLFKVLL